MASTRPTAVIWQRIESKKRWEPPVRWEAVVNGHRLSMEMNAYTGDWVVYSASEPPGGAPVARGRHYPHGDGGTEYVKPQAEAWARAQPPGPVGAKKAKGKGRAASSPAMRSALAGAAWRIVPPELQWRVVVTPHFHGRNREVHVASGPRQSLDKAQWMTLAQAFEAAGWIVRTPTFAMATWGMIAAVPPAEGRRLAWTDVHPSKLTPPSDAPGAYAFEQGRLQGLAEWGTGPMPREMETHVDPYARGYRRGRWEGGGGRAKRPVGRAAGRACRSTTTGRFKRCR